MPEFTNWHQAASEELLLAVDGLETLDRSQCYAEMELKAALASGHRKREVLARGILRVIEEMREVDREDSPGPPTA